MVDLKEVVNRVLLPVQLSLGLFQIMKTTPLWAVIHCALASLLNFFHFPYTDYKILKKFRGRVFKKVISHTTTAGTKAKKQKDSGKTKKEGKPEDVKPVQVEYLGEKQKESVQVEYLGEKFELERKDGNKMLMTDGPAYYITDKMWETVLYIEKVASKTVFLKDHKEIWEEVVTGDVMKFEEVLDSVILDNRDVIRLDNDYFLPVNLLRSEMKLMTTLNFVGLFLKTQKHIHWLIPALLTFASVIIGFSTTLRFWIGRLINKIFCKLLQLLCDLLPSAKRRWAYSLGNWVDNLKPGNDLKSKNVRGTPILLVAAGAKLDSKSFADCESLDPPVVRVLVDGRDSILVGGAESFSDSISVVVSGGAISDLETSTDCESLARLVIMVDNSNIHTFLTGGRKKIQPDELRQFANRSEGWVHYISPQVGPFLFKCDQSVYIEWIFDISNQICYLKAGRVASSESLIARDVSIIVCDAHGEDCTKKNGGKEYEIKSLIADRFDTSSIDVECSSSKEAIKLLKLAFYMAKYKTTSLKSYDRKRKKVTVRRFVESINAYVSSGYPPLYSLIMDEVVVH